MQRFMSKVKITDSCWLWIGSTVSGYGQFWNGQKVIRAHWFLLPRYPKEGEVACHKCDVKNCVNPEHVFVGTQKDNMQDASKKKRWAGWTSEARKLAVARGENSGKATLTDEQVAVIKSIPKKFGRGVALTRYFGVDPMVVGNIWNERHWTHIRATVDSREEANKLMRSFGWK